MAVQFYKPMRPLNEVIQQFVDEAEAQLLENISTQYIWPIPVYKDYPRVNEERRRRGGWYSTGAGEKSIGAKVVSASSPSNVTVLFHWNEYMDYVDRGVGKGRPIEKVKHEKKAKFKNRYIGVWQPKAGTTHRPALLMETRHVERRIWNYLEDFYGWEGTMRLVQAFDDIKIDFDFG